MRKNRIGRKAFLVLLSVVLLFPANVWANPNGQQVLVSKAQMDESKSVSKQVSISENDSEEVILEQSLEEAVFEEKLTEETISNEDLDEKVRPGEESAEVSFGEKPGEVVSSQDYPTEEKILPEGEEQESASSEDAEQEDRSGNELTQTISSDVEPTKEVTSESANPVIFEEESLSQDSGEEPEAKTEHIDAEEGTKEANQDAEKSTEEKADQDAEEGSPKEDDQEDQEDSEEEDADADLSDVRKEKQPNWSGIIQSEAEFQKQLKAFPASYQAGLKAIHAAFPNYSFTADYVNMDFEELVDYETKAKKVSAYSADSWKAMYDASFGAIENYNWNSGTWYHSEGAFTYASREVVEYYTDPRNFLNADGIYMFMRQSYSSDQTLDDLRSMMEGTYLADGYVPNKKEPNDVRLKGDYGAVIMEAAKKNGISPFVLTASIFVEHGYYGTTPLISGYYKAYDGTVYKDYYNFFDIHATGTDSNNVIQNGLEYAKSQGWISRYLSIVKGAEWIVNGYIFGGQDTYYYKEFNVINGWNSLWHQFSTGIQSAYVSQSLFRDVLQSKTYAALDFRIPVYNNMPTSPASLPAQNTKKNNYYFNDIQISGLTPAYTRANQNYSVSVSNNTVLKLAVPSGASYQSAKSFSLKKGKNTVTLLVKSQTGYTRAYHLTVQAAKACTLTVSSFSGTQVPAVYHLVKKNGKTYCYDENGVRQSGLRQVNGKYYFFYNNGVMLTGWLRMNGKYYYFDASGVRQTGLHKINGKYYFFYNNGVMLTGWLRMNGKYYHFDASGARQTGLQKIDGYWYFFYNNGVMLTGWLRLNGNYYYFCETGERYIGWHEIDGKWYHFGTDGILKTEKK